MKHLLFIALLPLLFACEKEISPEHLIIMHRWNKTSHTVTSPNGITTETITSSCQKDDIYNFLNGSTFYFNSETLCNPNEPLLIVSSYGIVGNKLFIRDSVQVEYEIKKLTKAKLELSSVKNGYIHLEKFRAL